MEKYALDKEFESLRGAQDAHEEELLDTPNVVGVALGHKVKGDIESKKPCLSVFVSHKLHRDFLHEDEVVKPKFDNVETDVIATGEIFAEGIFFHTSAGEDEWKNMPSTKTSNP